MEIDSEFTLHQTIAPSAEIYSALYGLEVTGGLIEPEKLERPDPMERPKERY